MPEERTTIENWLVTELASQLTAVFETMTGERPTATSAAAPEVPTGEGLWWRQLFSGAAGELWLFTPSDSLSAGAKLILVAAGMEDDDPATAKSTYLETANQAVSGLAQVISGRLEREVTPSDGSEQAPPPELRWGVVTLQSGAATVTIYVAPSSELLSQFELSESPPAPLLPVVQPVEDDSGTADFAKSKTFGLLLDVELPVSVSFGRAQVSLKEVLKLTTGSIVELNRSINEPVEVIVNNCVIARGEVVVVEGNFGIRIQHVIGRRERLRTLH